jgi:hypothetical protein
MSSLRNLESLPLNSYVTERHVAELRSSGLSDDTIRTARVYSADNRTTFRLLGYPSGPGLVFQYRDDYFRVKLDAKQSDGRQ